MKKEFGNLAELQKLVLTELKEAIEDNQDYASDSLRKIQQKLEAFQKKLSELDVEKWYAENQENIVAYFELHSHSGIKPEETLWFFLKKEVLGLPSRTIEATFHFKHAKACGCKLCQKEKPSRETIKEGES